MVIMRKIILLFSAVLAAAFWLNGCASDVERRIDGLKKPSSKVRYLSADALKGSDDRRAISALADALTDDDLEVVKAATAALGQMKDPLAIKPLIGLLDHPDQLVRYNAKKALENFGRQAVYPLVSTFRSQIEQKVLGAVQVLGNIRDERAVVPMDELLAHPSDVVRRAAAEALGEIGGNRSITHLIEHLSDPDPVVQHAAAESLEKLKPMSVMPLVAALHSADSNRVWRAAAVLGNINDPRAVGPLSALLAHGSDTVRMETVIALGKIKSPEVLEPLVFALGDTLAAVAAKASEGLVQYGAVSMDLLLSALSKGDPARTVHAAFTLGRIGDKRALDPLIGLLQSPLPEVQSAAAAALGDLHDDKALAPLISLLKTGAQGPADAAAKALAAMGANSVQPLLDSQEQGANDFRNRSISILSFIGKPAAPDLLNALDKSEEPARTVAADALVAIGEPAVELIFDALSADNAHLDQCLADILWRIGQGSVDVIAAGLKRQEEKVKISVIHILGQMDDPHAVQPLVEALTDWPVRAAAAQSLDRLGWRFKHKGDRTHYLMAKDDKKALTTEWEETYGVLMDDLKSGKKTAMAYAVYAFIELEQWDIFSVLKKELDKDVRIPGIAKACIAPILETLVHPDPDVRTKAVETLVSVGVPAVSPLVEALAAQHPEIERTIADVLVSMGEDAVGALIPHLEDPSVNARKTVANVLGGIGDKRAVTPLVSALYDWPVRRTAAEALEALDWEPELPEEEIHYFLATAEKEDIISRWQQVRETLMADLRSAKQQSIVYAVQAFLKIVGENSADELISMLSTEGYMTMAEAYWDSGDPRLMNAAKEWAVAYGYDTAAFD